MYLIEECVVGRKYLLIALFIYD